MDKAEKKFYLLMEYGVGGDIDHEKMDFLPSKRHGSGVWYEFRTDHVELCKKIGICNGFRVWKDVCKERVQDAMEGGFACLIEIWMPAGHWVEWAARRDMKAQEMVDGMVDYARELVKKHPDSVWVNTFAENDNAPWVNLKFPVKTRAELYETLKNYFSHDDYWNMDGKGVPGKVQGNPFDYLKQRGIEPSEINMITLYCREFSPHLLYELGAEFAWPEGNVGSNNQIAIAFVRGAASQYDKHWIYDTALFDCQGSEIPTAYDSRLRRFSGFSEDYMLNAWMLSFVSGVKIFLFQSADICFFMKKDSNSLSLSPAGEIAKDFADFTLRNHTDRGEPCVPVAIMLPRDHGYATNHHASSRIFWGKAPNDAANKEIEGFFRLAFPGCHETHGFGFDINAWAPSGSREKQQSWNKDIKDSSKQKGEWSGAFHKAIVEGFDQRPLEKAFMTVSTWGDSFDVLVDNASSGAMSKYKGLMLMGGCKIDAALREKLSIYVKNGGHLFLNISNVSKEDEELLGVKLSGEEIVNFYHAHSVLTGRVFDDGLYNNEKLVIGKAEPVMYCGHFGDVRNPLVTRNKFGKGEVWFTAAYFNQGVDKYDLSWLESSKEAADEFIRPLIDVEVFGKPVHWALNRRDDGSIWVSVFNNTAENWGGRILLKNMKGVVSARDIWSEKTASYELDEQGRVVLKLEIAPWKFKIIEIVSSAKLS